MRRSASSAPGQGPEPLLDSGAEARPEDRLVGGALEHQVPGRGDVERLAQQLVQVEHLHTALGKRVRERVVLLAGAA